MTSPTDHSMSASNALTTFLRERRANVDPQTVGLPAQTRRPGLTREHVAELAGVTPLWYALFESGSSGRRFSAAFIERVTDALQLEPADRARLLRLIVFNGSAAFDVEARWYAREWEELNAEMTESARRVAAAPNKEIAAHLALGSFGALLKRAAIAITVPHLALE